MTPTVVVTRPRHSYESITSIEKDILALGASPCSIEVVELRALPLAEDHRRSLLKVVKGEASWVFFLSPNSVFFARQQMAQSGVFRLSTATRIAVQGPGTADAVRACFARAPDFKPAVSIAENLVAEFAAAFPEDRNAGPIVLPESAGGRHVVGPALGQIGFTVESFPLYESVLVPPNPREWRKITALAPKETLFLLMSPTAVRGVTQAFGEAARTLLPQYSAVAIGPTTADAAKTAGFGSVTLAETHDREGVLSALRTSPTIRA
jgi:uroporphyrinogen-III synthase